MAPKNVSNQDTRLLITNQKIHISEIQGERKNNFKNILRINIGYVRDKINACTNRQSLQIKPAYQNFKHTS